MNSNATSSAAPSTVQEGSFELNSECFRYTKSHSKDHEKEYKALKVKFNYCGEIGHNEKCCKKAGFILKELNSTRDGAHFQGLEKTLD